MAKSIPLCCCSTQSTTTSIPILNKTHVKPRPYISNFALKSTMPSRKDIFKHASLREAFQSFRGLFADETTAQFCFDEAYAPILERCASKKALSQGQQIHAHMIKSYVLCHSVFLRTKLVFMYGNCMSLLSAEKVFNRMCERSIFTWNAMIAAYVSNGKPLKALELFRHMRLLAVSLDSCTFPCVLKACGMLEDHFLGAEIHSLAIKYGYSSTVFVLNSLVAMYAKCNDLDGARKLFSHMDGNGDSVSWNSMISAYSANKQSLEALALFREMKKVNCTTDTYTYVAALQACENSFFGKLGREIHAAILKSNHYLDIYVANALLAMYVRCNKISKAASIFRRLDDKDNVSWNTMLSGFVQNGLYNEALLLFHEMRDSSQKPDQVSILNLIAASARAGNLMNGMEIHAYAIKNMFDSDLLVGNTLIDMYAKCYCVDFMGRTFNKMPNKDIISWTTIIAGYSQNNHHLRAFEYFRMVLTEGIDVDAMMIGSILSSCSGLKCNSSLKEIHGYVIRRSLSDLVLQNSIIDVYGECGKVGYAKRMFESVESKNVVTWTSMISCYVHNGLPNEALNLFYYMSKESNAEPDYVSLVSVLSAAASLSSLKKGREIHGFLIRKGFIIEGPISSALVDMYSRCGTIQSASKVFIGIKNVDIVLWTAMINGYGMHGHGKSAVDLFNTMESKYCFPDHITFMALLYACSHSGLIEEGKKVLEIMKSKYHLEPWPEHYVCLVDLLARANCLDEAYQFIQSMQIEPTAEVWSALLGGCRVHSNKELAEIAVHELLKLDLANPGKYVLASNVFAESGRWKDVGEVRTRMRGIRLKKSPGCSWIEVGNKVHAFMARDKAHPRSKDIYQKLDMITERLEKEGGYVPRTRFVMHNVDDEVKIQMLSGHSERLAIAYGLIETPERSPIRITKNLRICGDCHTFCKLVSKLFQRRLIVRDANRFHDFEGGLCSCCDFW